MTPKTKRQITAQIQFIAKEAMRARSVSEEYGRLTIFGGERGGFVLVNEAAVAYEELYKRLVQDEGWGEKFSEDHVDKALRAIIDKLRHENSTANATTYFEDLLASFETYSQEHLVYVLLAGIRLEQDSFPIGKLNLRRLTDALIDEITNNAGTILMQSTNTPEEKALVVAQVTSLLSSLKRKGMTCGEYRVVAEPERARERAEEEARRVLDVLRYSLPALYSDRLRVAVGLVGDIGRTVRLTPIFSADNTFFRLATQRIGSLSEFELSAENVQTMTEIGAFEIANLLSLRSKQLSSFEDVLLRAVHWFANAQTQTDQENELLSLVTSLETFFTPEPGEPIADAVARGVACVVSTDPATQAYLYRRMKKLYDERSRIAHGGAKVILRKDLDELELIAAEVIAVLVRRKGEFTGKVGKKALQNWVKKQMLANEHSMQSEEMAD